MKEVELGVGIDNHEPVGLGHLRGDFRQVLGARDADRDRQAKLVSHAAADRACDVGRRTEEMGAASNVGKGLVDGDPLDEGREVIEHRDGGIAQPLVILEVAADENQLRAELARLPARHAAAHAEGLGFVRSGKHDTAADRDRLAAQGRVEQLLDRGVEGIQVSMEDGGRRSIPTVQMEQNENMRPRKCQAA